MLKPLVDQLVQDLGRPPLHAEEDGSFMLKVEPEISVKIRENPTKGITLFAPLAQLTTKRQEDIFAFLMSVNLFGRETGPAVLGLDKDAKWITMTSFLPEGIDYKTFHDALEDFVNYAEVWRDDLTRLQKEGK